MFNLCALIPPRLPSSSEFCSFPRFSIVLPVNLVLILYARRLFSPLLFSTWSLLFSRLLSAEPKSFLMHCTHGSVELDLHSFPN